MARYNSPDDVTLKDVLEYLRVNATHTNDGFVLHDGGDTMPSGDKILQVKQELFEKDQGTHYRTQRSRQYPSVETQLDMLWHAMHANESARLEPFYTTILRIKNQYPKS